MALPPTLLEQVELLAHQLNMPRDQLFEMAIENFVQRYADQALLDEAHKLPHDLPPTPNDPSDATPQHAAAATHMEGGRTVVNQGDIYWIQAQEPQGSELGYYAHPYVVIQDDLFNHSRINSVVVCALTSNTRQAHEPGNVLLDAGEANLPKQSAVVVSKISTVAKSQLGEYVGTLTAPRIDQILAGMRFLQRAFFAR